MSLCLCTGGMLACSMGTMPGTFQALPFSGVLVEGRPAGKAADFVPLENIPSFGLCRSLLNPEVAQATGAAMGVLTPMPCVPVPQGGWEGACSRTQIGSSPALLQGSVLRCLWSGQIQVRLLAPSRVQL